MSRTREPSEAAPNRCYRLNHPQSREPLLTMRGPAIVAALSEGPLVVLTRTASVVLKLFFDQGVVLRGTTVE